MRTFLTILFLCISAPLTLCLRTQIATVKGEFVCQFTPEKNVEIQLWEADSVDKDDHLATITGKKDGSFLITGSTSELTPIEPYIIITTSCNAKEGCTRSFKEIVPKKFVGKTYDMGKVQLQVHHEGETTNCTGGTKKP